MQRALLASTAAERALASHALFVGDARQFARAGDCETARLYAELAREWWQDYLALTAERQEAR